MFRDTCLAVLTIMARRFWNCSAFSSAAFPAADAAPPLFRCWALPLPLLTPPPSSADSAMFSCWAIWNR